MPALMIPTFIENAGALPMATLTNVSQVKEYELAASEHWIFNKAGTSNLVGIKNGGALTVAGASPTHNAASLTLANGAINGLSSTFADSLTYTLCCVAKAQTVGTQRTLFATAAHPTGGASLTWQLGTSFDLLGPAEIGGSTVNQFANTTDFTAGAWYFIALVMDHSGANRLRRFQAGAANFDFTDTAAFTPHPTVKLSLGDPINASNSGEFAEFIAFSGSALTATQLGQVYLRSKARLLRQSGITVA